MPRKSKKIIDVIDKSEETRPTSDLSYLNPTTALNLRSNVRRQRLKTGNGHGESRDAGRVLANLLKDEKLEREEEALLNGPQLPPARKTFNVKKEETKNVIPDEDAHNVQDSELSEEDNNGAEALASFRCSFCAKEFKYRSDFNCHLRIHTGEKPFKCKQCGKMFGRKGNFNAHSVVHTGKKPFKCKQCGKLFGRKDNLADHSRIHRGEKPFICDVCGAFFTKQDHLSRHKRIHSGETPYQCLHCNKAFRNRASLTYHIRTHTGENKPFTCEVCGVRFAKTTSLIVHKRVHSEETP